MSSRCETLQARTARGDDGELGHRQKAVEENEQQDDDDFKGSHV